ncbi:MAG: hypothetical protein HYT94_02085 [Parcubacteria group bacterium]|nr:hypothetical protein [Parcubacteria group bacterium]
MIKIKIRTSDGEEELMFLEKGGYLVIEELGEEEIEVDDIPFPEEE